MARGADAQARSEKCTTVQVHPRVRGVIEKRSAPDGQETVYPNASATRRAGASARPATARVTGHRPLARPKRKGIPPWISPHVRHILCVPARANPGGNAERFRSGCSKERPETTTSAPTCREHASLTLLNQGRGLARQRSAGRAKRGQDAKGESSRRTGPLAGRNRACLKVP